MGITQPYDAFCLDQAVFVFGTAVRDAVETASQSQGNQDNERKRKRRAQTAFNRMLGIQPKFQGVPSKAPKKASEVDLNG